MRRDQQACPSCRSRPRASFDFRVGGANAGRAWLLKAPPPGTSGFVPLRPLYRVEHAFAQIGRWRRLSRCYEGTAASALAWLEVAAMGYLFARLRVEPA
jgi:hypothetical protein